MLSGPYCRAIEHASNTNSVWKATLDRSLDEARCEESQRNRHVDMPRAAVLPSRDVVDRRRTRLDLGEPEPPARDRGDEFGPRLHPDRTRFTP
jgi:hypothetical protein